MPEALNLYINSKRKHLSMPQRYSLDEFALTFSLIFYNYQIFLKHLLCFIYQLICNVTQGFLALTCLRPYGGVPVPGIVVVRAVTGIYDFIEQDMHKVDWQK
ncbi:hypothetical protein ACJX0J_032441 [Zea mays]